MNEMKPLAAASRRFRGRPGRPRKTPPTAAQSGHDTGTTSAKRLMNGVPPSSALDQESSVPLAPRLLSVNKAAVYLGVSPWTIRDMHAAGRLQRVRLPLAGREELRRLLFDRLDLDRLVEAAKQRVG
jgi:hypothetical protein